MTEPVDRYGQQPYGHPPPHEPPRDRSGIPTGGPPKIARMRDRLIARVIDWLLMTGVFLAVLVSVFAVGEATEDPSGEASGVGLAVLFLGIIAAVAGVLLYEPVMIATRGATVGKMVMKLTVRMEATGVLPTTKASVFRFGLPLLASLAPFGSFLIYMSPLFDNSGRRQGWHDKIAGTVVVKG